jgi:hypothetical protein
MELTMLKKQVVESRQVVKVTFDLPRSELPEGMDVDSVYLDCVVITPALAANANGESDA